MFPQYTNFVRKMRLIPRNKRKPEDGGDISSDVFSEFDFDNWNELDGLISDADLSVTSESISEGRETPVIIDTNRLHVVPDSRTTPPPPLPQRRERPIITLRRSPSRPISPPLEKTPGRIGYEDEARPQTPPPQPEMSLYKVMFGQDEPAEKPKTKLWLGKKKKRGGRKKKCSTTVEDPSEFMEVFVPRLIGNKATWTCEIRKRPSLLNKRKLSAMLPELQQHRAVKPEAKPEPKPRPAPLERIATLPSKKLQKILPKPNVPTTPLAASITKESTDMEDIKDIMRTMGRKKMERKLRRRTRHHLGSESETESQNSEERQLPDKPAWMTTALGISMKAARFKVPVDARVLQDMTPLDYVKRYCVATSHRINLCRKIYRRNQQQAQTMNFEGLVSALGELFTTNLDKDGLDKIINLLAVDEHIRVDEKLFIAIAAFTERVLCPRPATDNSESKTVHHKKDMLEYADFRRTAQNIKNVKVAPNVQRIIQILMEQLER